MSKFGKNAVEIMKIMEKLREKQQKRLKNCFSTRNVQILDV